MARLARLVVPGLPHHVTQRGNGRARTFFEDDDYALYRDLLAENCRAAGVAVWAWCLMPNHVHLVLVPADADGLRGALAATHRRYAGILHARRKRTGHFWQAASDRWSWTRNIWRRRCATCRSIRRARGWWRAPRDWRWSSVRAHLYGRDDRLTTPRPVLERFAPFRDFLDEPADPATLARLRAAESVGVRWATRHFSRGSSAPPSERCGPASAAQS